MGNFIKRYFVGAFFLAVFTSLGFTQVPIFLSGETRLEWGANFANNANGFKNTAKININFPLVPLKTIEYGTSAQDLQGDKSVNEESSSEEKRKLSRRAEISIKDFEWIYRFESLNAGTPQEATTDITEENPKKGHAFKIGNISAKLFLDSVYIDIIGNTKFSTNFAKKPSPLNDFNESWTEEYDWLNERLIVGTVNGKIAGATKIGYFNEDIGIKDLGAKFASTTNFTDNSRQNVVSDYFAGLDFSFLTASKKLDISGAFQAGSFRQASNWFGFGLSSEFKPFPEFRLYAGFDGTYGSGSAHGVTYRIDEVTDTYVPCTASFACDGELTCNYKFFDFSAYGLYLQLENIPRDYYDIGFKVGVYDGGFVNALKASVAFVCDEILNSPDLDSSKRFNSSIDINFSYKWLFNDINYLKPFAKTAISFSNYETYVKAGFEYGLLHLATIYAYYQQGDITDIDDYGLYVMSWDSFESDPKLVFGLKVEF